MCLLLDNFRRVKKTQFTDLQRVEKNFWKTFRNRELIKIDNFFHFIYS